MNYRFRNETGRSSITGNLFRHACGLGLEGIVSKRIGSRFIYFTPERLRYHHGGGSGVIGGEPFIVDHSASCASLSCSLLSASRLSCSFDHQAKHVSPIMNAKTSPFCSSRCREVLLLITRSPHQSLM